MALTTTQVNQAFLGLLGRPATGAEAAKFAGQLDAATLAQTLLTDASFKTQLSLEAPSFKTVDLLNTDPAAFVESLYTALLGRASDAEGKAFWLSVAGATPNRADVVSQFIAAVKAQEGTADANAFATIQAEDKALANAWVESLYNNLAGRSSDAEGLDFWTNAIVSFTMTPAQVAASFAAALALQGNTTEDGQNYLAKQGVADNFTANFKDFNNLLTANEKATSLGNLVTMMNGVNKDSQVEQYTEEITKFSGEYQNIKAIQFTTKDDDNLGVDPETGEPNTTSGVNFTGTYNLTDETKGTIQSSDSVTGNENYKTDTLTVNVIGYNKDDNTKQTLDLDNSLPSVTSVERLNINNGAAEVKATTLNGFDYITVNGTGKFNITGATSSDAAVGFKDIVLSSGATKEGQTGNTFTTTETVQSFKSTNGNDNVELNGVEKSIETGAGKDDITINGTLGEQATLDAGAGNDTVKIDDIAKNASIKLGAGDDKLTIKSTASANGNTDNDNNIIATIDIDAGTGVNDELTLSAVADTTDLRAIKSIKGVEKLVLDNQNATATSAHTLYASALSGQSIELSATAAHSPVKGADLILDAKGASNVDLSKFKNAANQDVKIEITNVKSGNVSLETNSKNTNLIKETIVLAKDAKGVTVKGFEANGDKIAVEGATSKAGQDAFSYTGNKITGFAASVEKNTVYTTKTTDSISLSKLKDFSIAGMQAGDEFYVIAYDQKLQNPSSVAKVYKLVVGNDGTKLSSVEQMATINVANKGVIKPTDIIVDPSSKPVVTDALKLSATGSQTLDLSKDLFNSEAKPVTTSPAIVVDGVDGKLTISNTNDVTKTITTTMKTGGNIDFSGQGAANGVAIDVKVGGTYVEKVGETAAHFEKTTGTVTIATGMLKADTDKVAEVWQQDTNNKVSFQDAAALDGVKLDLSNVDAKIAISALATTDVAATKEAGKADLAELFVATSVNKDDAIEVTLASGNKGVALTNAAETVKLATTSTGVALTNFTKASSDTAGKDIINLSSVGVTTIDATVIHDSNNKITSLTSDKLYYSSVAVDENGDSKLDADFVGIINTKTLTSGSSIYAAEVIGDTTKIYKITTKGASLAADDTVSLIATLDTALTHNGGNIIA